MKFSKFLSATTKGICIFHRSFIQVKTKQKIKTYSRKKNKNHFVDEKSLKWCLKFYRQSNDRFNFIFLHSALHNWRQDFFSSFDTRLLCNNQADRSVSQKSICCTPGVCVFTCLRMCLSVILSLFIYLFCYLNFFGFVHVSACLYFSAWWTSAPCWNVVRV